jgi:hypothetical protein
MARKQQTSIVVPSIRRQMQSRARPPQLTHSRSGSGACLGNSTNRITGLFDTHLHAKNVYADTGAFTHLNADELCEGHHGHARMRY